MKKMTKVMSMALAASLVVASLTACGGSEKKRENAVEFNRFSPQKWIFHPFPRVFHGIFPQKTCFSTFLFGVFREGC